MSLDTTKGSPDSDLKSIEWIAGSWGGEAFGATAEEVWNPASGGSMMGMFKLYDEKEVVFYELMIIKEVNATLMMQLKHFGPGLKGWETQDETVDFRLVEVRNNKVFFDGLTFERVSKDEITVYVVVDHKDGTRTEEKFRYLRL